MRVILHDEPHEVPDHTTVAELLHRLSLHDAACAVAINTRFVPRSEHTRHELRPDDRIDILAPMQGG